MEDLLKRGVDIRIWEVLDEKYGPQPRDLLQHAMKNFFYDLQLRPSEIFTQFRDHALRQPYAASEQWSFQHQWLDAHEEVAS